ncbi:hypothetical protein PPACK8108_LOCUS21383 [Phakopsora pachyrhizi]|uniref:Uncharacterized protein n=1 Tax=Phakopsora pachyrhizi TaxID=170000 RepID=A0AAV0BJG0_PHAPC|nr:hypothetical protein PPACK8108_LOCUS21383 [Phakopsora pachyrhizi]
MDKMEQWPESKPLKDFSCTVVKGLEERLGGMATVVGTLPIAYILTPEDDQIEEHISQNLRSAKMMMYSRYLVTAANLADTRTSASQQLTDLWMRSLSHYITMKLPKSALKWTVVLYLSTTFIVESAGGTENIGTFQNGEAAEVAGLWLCCSFEGEEKFLVKLDAVSVATHSNRQISRLIGFTALENISALIIFTLTFTFTYKGTILTGLNKGIGALAERDQPVLTASSVRKIWIQGQWIDPDWLSLPSYL